MLKPGVIAQPINHFDPEVEQVAGALWRERGFEEFYLLEWKYMDRPFPAPRVDGDAYIPARTVLRDAQAIVTARRTKIQRVH